MKQFKFRNNLGLMMYAKPTNSNKRSEDWLKHHLPINAIRKHLIASRINLRLSINDVNEVVKQLREGTDYSTWGNPGHIQVHFNSIM